VSDSGEGVRHKLRELLGSLGPTARSEIRSNTCTTIEHPFERCKGLFERVFVVSTSLDRRTGAGLDFARPTNGVDTPFEQVFDPGGGSV